MKEMIGSYAVKKCPVFHFHFTAVNLHINRDQTTINCDFATLGSQRYCVNKNCNIVSTNHRHIGITQ